MMMMMMMMMDKIMADDGLRVECVTVVNRHDDNIDPTFYSVTKV